MGKIEGEKTSKRTKKFSWNRKNAQKQILPKSLLRKVHKSTFYIEKSNFL